MTESASIARYIAEKHSLHDIYPIDPVKRHKIDSMMDFHLTTILPGFSGYLGKVKIYPALGAGPVPKRSERV